MYTGNKKQGTKEQITMTATYKIVAYYTDRGKVKQITEDTTV